MVEPAEERPRSNLERRRLGGPEGIALLLSAVILGALGWWWTHREAPPPPAPEPVATAPAPEAPPPAPIVAPVAPEQARPLVEDVSSDADFRRWTAEGDLVQRWVVVTDNLAEGVSPRRVLDFLVPEKPFAVDTRGEKKVIAPAAYARYDRLADVVRSGDARAAAKLYRALRGPLEAAYRALGYPAAKLDDVTARALRRLEGAPVRDGDIEVVPVGGTWAFADPALEELGEIDKHLLRLGPRNARVVQAKARELREALGLPAAAR
jgi:hypothetical protein